MYEYAISILCRVIQLAIKDEATAKKIALYASQLEVTTRVIFYVAFAKTGLEGGGKMMTHNEYIRYVTSGKLRVADAENDMQVEYVSTIAAMSVLLYLPKTGAFDFPVNDVSDEQIIAVSEYQLVAEVVVDFICCYIENFGCLSELHRQVWSFETGRFPGDPFYKCDLVRAVVFKYCLVIICTGFMLIVSMREN